MVLGFCFLLAIFSIPVAYVIILTKIERYIFARRLPLPQWENKVEVEVPFSLKKLKKKLRKKIKNAHIAQFDSEGNIL
jgi:hypothetical protein